MPQNPIVDATFRVVTKVHDGASGDDMLNVFHCTDPGGAGTFAERAEPIADIFAAAWEDHLIGAYADHFRFSEVLMWDLATDPAAVFAKSYAIDATGVGQALPYQSAAVVTWRTALGGRSGRGRSYIGPSTEDLSDGRSLSATLLTGLDAWATQLIANLITNESPLTVVSYRTNNDWRLVNQSLDVESFVVRPQWCTQRRRAS